MTKKLDKYAHIVDFMDLASMETDQSLLSLRRTLDLLE